MATEAVCPKCGGSGFVIIEHANVSAAEPCDCRFQVRAERALERAQIPPHYQNVLLDSFSLPGPENPTARAQLGQVFLTVKGYVRDYRNEARPGLLLIGEPGTGKTHLAVGALREILKKGYDDCVFCDYQNLLDRIRAGYDPSSNSSDKEAYRIALDTEVLLLDDLGAHRVTDWVLDTVTSIITYRCNHNKTLIATTNLPDPDAGSAVIGKSADGRPEYRRTLADHIGDRARSRLFEMCTVVRMPLVEDYRLRKARTF